MGDFPQSAIQESGDGGGVQDDAGATAQQAGADVQLPGINAHIR